MSNSFHISLLARQRLLLVGQFAERYPHPWLVWELGSFAADDRARQDMVATSLPPDPRLLRPAKSDPVCFPLIKSATILGRGEGSDIAVPDATVSRHHLLLRQMTDSWGVQLIAPQTTATLGAAELEPGVTHPLRSGDRLSLPGVELLFLSSADLIRRLDELNRAPR